MAYEILNQAIVTPHRLHSLLLLVSKIDNSSKKDIVNLLQPPGISQNRKIANEVYKAALNCGLIVENNGGVSIGGDAQDIFTVDEFRKTMQGRVLGINDENKDNFLLNIYSAWYCAQDEQVFRFTRKEFETIFIDQLYPNAKTRPFNTTKFNGWRNWAAFLGLGWLWKRGQLEILIPNAFWRLLPLLEEFLPNVKEEIEFSNFINILSQRCPELDHGSLYERAKKASTAGEYAVHELSLMLSNGLQLLDDRGHIELTRVADAQETFRLFKTEGQEIQEITHIRRR